MKSLENIIGFDALYESMHKCVKGVMWKDSTAAFYLHGLERVIRLENELEGGTYMARPCVHFTVTSPKRREIASVAFRDRVYQRSLNDNAIYPVMSKSFIYDNCACQKGKGTDFARGRLKDFLRKHYRHHRTDGYVLQLDIKGYYPNMSHAVAEATFREKLDPEVYELAVRILREQYEGDRGYNPGSQLIQIAGISVLNGLDHYIKEQLHIKYYVRYMDDLILIHPDKEYLLECRKAISAYLSALQFSLNEGKSRVYAIEEGIGFLGFTFKLTSSGKVLMMIKSDSVRRQRRKLKRLVTRSKKGLIPKPKVDESYAAWRNHASKGNSFKLLTRMDAYYKNLWRD